MTSTAVVLGMATLGTPVASLGLRLRDGQGWKHCHEQSDHEFHRFFLSI